ncbi:MAG: methyltransferase, partial [Proteobacteria bacterium]|nr:methyltransferase [Pseudomonadota bacterium]
GANAEGIRSAAVRLEHVSDAVTTIATRHHCRILAGQRKTTIDGLKSRLEDWREARPITLCGRNRSWVSYPGTFAGGGLDAGTALLIDCLGLADIAEKRRILDFAAGTGVISAAIKELNPGAHVDMLEADAIALDAARANVPGTNAIVGDSLASARGAPYDLIVSNPPIHDGVAESHAVLERLIGDAPRYLAPHGALLLVVQRRVPVITKLSKAFSASRMLADDGRFSVAIAERKS